MKKSFGNVINILWPLLFYIVAEAFFQWHVQKTYIDMNSNNINSLEILGRVMFGFSLAMFVYFITHGLKRSIISFFIGIFIATGTYHLIYDTISLEKQEKYGQNMLYLHKYYPNQTSKILSVYSEDTTAIRSDEESYMVETYQHLIPEKSLKASYEKMDKYLQKKRKSHLKKWGGYDLGEKYSQMDKDGYQLLLRSFNEAFYESLPQGLMVNNYAHEFPLGKTIRIEDGYSAFKEDVYKWLYLEVQNNKLQRKNMSNEIINQTAIILPLALIFSSLGILMNTLLMVYNIVDYFTNQKTARCAVAVMMATMFFFGLLLKVKNVSFVFYVIMPIIHGIQKLC